MIIKSSLGLSFGVIFSVLLFKRRAWPAWVGLGFGAGRAWEEADGMWNPSSVRHEPAKLLLQSKKAPDYNADYSIQLPSDEATPP